MNQKIKDWLTENLMTIILVLGVSLGAATWFVDKGPLYDLLFSSFFVVLGSPFVALFVYLIWKWIKSSRKQQYIDEAKEGVKEIGSEIGRLVVLAITSGVVGGIVFLFLKFAYGIYHNYTFSESIATLFTPYGLIVFGIGFITGAIYPFVSR